MVAVILIKWQKPFWPDDFRLMLHASSLQFNHPITDQMMTLKADFSDKIVNILNSFGTL